MKKINFLLLVCITASYISMAQSPTQMYGDLLADFKKYDASAKDKLVSPKSLDKYFVSRFGKVALDNNNFINNATAFNASFSNTDAQISANYTSSIKSLMKKNVPAVWSLGLKGGSQDGTYYLFKTDEINWDAGIKGGITILGWNNAIDYPASIINNAKKAKVKSASLDMVNNNKALKDATPDMPKVLRNMVNHKVSKYSKRIKTIDAAEQYRQDSILDLMVSYYNILSTNEAALQSELDKLDIEQSRAGLNKLDYSDMSTDFFQTPKLSRAEFIKRRDSLQHIIAVYKKIYKSLADQNAREAYIDSLVQSNMWQFEQNIIGKFSDGYKMKWYDIKGSATAETKNVLDFGNSLHNYIKLVPFGRYTLSPAFNYYRDVTKMLSYVRVGLDMGNGYGYDLLIPGQIQVDTILAANGGKSVSNVSESVKAFNPAKNPTYNRMYGVVTESIIADMFWGKKKMIGFELSESLGLMHAPGSTKAPLNFQGGVLLSPVDKDPKTSNGVIALLVGMQKLDLTNTHGISIGNFTVGIRVGLPVGTPNVSSGK